MGIRNLAYCVLDVANVESLVEKQKRILNAENAEFVEKIDGMEDSAHREALLQNMTVSQWRRLAVSSPPSTSPSPSTTSSHNLTNASTTTATSTREPNEQFTPANLASIANHLATNVLLPLKPTHILIERQRFRSGGGSAVLEWTLRVNTLESMFFAVFECLRMQWGVRRLGLLPGHVRSRQESAHGVQEEGTDVLATLDVFPQVLSVSPRKVANFWINGGEETSDAVLETDMAAAAPIKSSKRKTISKALPVVDVPLEDDAEMSVPPSTAAEFTTETTSTTPARTAPRSKIEKEAKIALAESWLTSNILRCEGSAAETREAFLARRNGRRGSGLAVKTKKPKKKVKKGRKGKRGAVEEVDEEQTPADGDGVEAVETAEVKELEKIPKLDDLADCALQGAAWASWEVNKILVEDALRTWKEGVAKGKDETTGEQEQRPKVAKTRREKKTD